MSNSNSIEVHNLVKKFGHFVANDNLNFTVGQGEIFGFLGANGAGKTTAMRILCGLLSPTSGKATVAGYDVFTQNEKIKKSVGYMSQRFSLYEDLTLHENIRFYGSIYGIPRKTLRERESQLLKRLGVWDKRDELIAGLPLGWRQKLAFSLALIHHPKIIFLDEPTGGVDPITRRQFWEMIHETASRGITVFVTTHYMDEAEYCDRVSIMTEGKIRALDTPDGLKETYKAETINEVFLKLAR